jgi:hypothetical protein
MCIDWGYQAEGGSEGSTTSSGGGVGMGHGLGFPGCTTLFPDRFK